MWQKLWRLWRVKPVAKMAETNRGGEKGALARNGVHRRDEDNGKKRETCA